MHHRPRAAQHWPFESVFLRDFEVVEELHGPKRLFPHTEQLPVLSRAINLEFHGGLPQRIASTDHRADTYRKLCLRVLANHFCTMLNGARPDRLCVFMYYTPDFVTKIAVVQEISEHSPLGANHRFRLFHGKEFLPDIHLNGKRIEFSTHAIERFGERALRGFGTSRMEMLEMCFDQVPAFLRVNGRGLALVYHWLGTVVALPVEEKDERFFITTCLGMNKIRSMKRCDPPLHPNLHYGPAYSPPSEDNWNFDRHVQSLIDCWRAQKPAPPPPRGMDQYRRKRWSQLAAKYKDAMRDGGFTEKTRISFQNNLHGPSLLFTNLNPPHQEPPDKETDKGRSGEWAKLEDLNAAIERDPKNHDAYYSRALLYKDRNDEVRALADLAKVIELCPTHQKAYNERAWMQYKRGDFDAARRDVTEAIRLSPQDSYAYDTRAWIEHAQGDLPAAEADCRKSLELVKSEAAGHYTRGLLYYMTKEYALAVTEWTKALENSPVWIKDLTPWLEKALQAAGQ